MKSQWTWICLLPAALLMIGIAGCASTPQPFAYHDDRDQKPGPGLLSGEAGGFVIYGESVEAQAEPNPTATDKDPD